MQEMRNHVTLIGNLGSDVQVTELSTGAKVARVSIATNEFGKNKEGERVQSTQWHNLVGWGPKADHMARFLAKGSYVIIHGKLVHRSYEDRNGNTRYLSEVVVNHFEAPKKQAS